MAEKMKNADKLRAWREKQKPKLSQFRAAAMIDTFQGTWAAWEQGTRCPDVGFALAVEKLTDGAVPASGWARRRKHKSAPKQRAARAGKSAVAA